MKIERWTAVAALVLIAGSSAILAGPLDPPAGPVGSTYKTLTEVEPRVAISAANTPGNGTALRVINKPGSYYLTENLVGASGQAGILIQASEVTIDLMGFELVGVTGSGDGITVGGDGQYNDITVLNGSANGWDGDGVNLSSGSSFNGRIEGVRAMHNKGSGLVIGSAGLITNCLSTYNKGTGFAANSGSVISHCAGSNNGARGVYVEDGCTVTSCSLAASGFEGIRTGDGCGVLDCTLRFNSWDGVRVGNGCRVSGVTAQGNGTKNGAGVHAAGSRNRIEGNTCTDGGTGIWAEGTGNFIARNTCGGNTGNWSIASNNVYGPIVDRTSPGSAAVFTNSAPDATGSAHPNANFSY